MNIRPFIHVAGLALALSISCNAQAANSPEFRSLFNGKDLTGWKGEGYAVEEGAIVCTPEGKNLFTEATFANYILTFEFKLPPGGNNGLGIHYPGEGNGAYSGMELQVLDNTADKYKDLKDYQFHGSLYTLQAAKREGLKPVGEWNQQTVTIEGPMVTVVLNGTEILKANLDELEKSNPKHEGVKRRSGHIAFLGHGDKVAFRKIRVVELPPSASGNEGTAIFNGSSLAGWKHEEGIANWTVHNGIIKHDGQKGPTVHLWTEKPYKNFTMVFDWRWSGRGPQMKRPLVQPDGSQKGEEMIEEFDSGVLLRGNVKSQVNLWNWNCGSGEVYGYRTDKGTPQELKAALVPSVKADKPIGEWNHMEVTLQGELLSVTLNGKQVIKEAKLPGIPESGPIGFQHHGSPIDFANVVIKEH